MTPGEILSLLRVAKPPAPYGARKLARCYSIGDVARVARRRLPLGARAYLDGGGEGEYTLRRNRAAFDQLEFLPVEPRDVSGVDTASTVLGQRIPLPFALSPIGAPRMFHHEGELAVARAVRHYGIPYGLSTLATTSMEDVAVSAPSPAKATQSTAHPHASFGGEMHGAEPVIRPPARAAPSTRSNLQVPCSGRRIRAPGAD
jgi:L-lactate dehydrogenase (cytochrome)